jgi:hypothetical protein
MLDPEADARTTLAGLAPSGDPIYLGPSGSTEDLTTYHLLTTFTGSAGSNAAHYLTLGQQDADTIN